MEDSLIYARLRGALPASPGDFYALLAEAGHSLTSKASGESQSAETLADTRGTTVLALKYKGGVLNLGDRRATSEHMVMYDRAEKILPLDDHTVLAVSGSYARAMEVVRYLRHAFQYYRRTQLQEMSLEGKVSEVSRMIAANLTSAMQGIGGFLPILSAWDTAREEGRIFFYDALGARFESAEFGAQGTWAQRIRGIFDYVVKTKGPFHEMSLEQVLREGLVLLDIAADLDALTGGYSKVPPLALSVSAEGVNQLSEETVQGAVEKIGAENHGD